MCDSSLLRLLFACLAFASLALSLPSPVHENNEPLVRLLYEYPLDTWIENIAVRPSGEILLTRLDKPELDQLNPFQHNPAPTKLHTFDGTLGLTGIAEIAPDSFTVAAGNFSFTSGGQVGSWSVWNVTFPASHHNSADFSKIADVPQAKFLNGMCNLPCTPSPNNILIGDIEQGVIRRVDTTTGAVTLILNDTFTAIAKDPVFGDSGVNGVHVKDETLYFTNTARQLFARVPIHADGMPSGQPSVIQHVSKSEHVFYFDDFAIRGEDAYLVTGSGNSIERTGLDGTPKGRIIAGSLNSTMFAEPTSAAFGRTEADRDVLYVVTAGGFASPVDGNITIGAQVLAVDTSRWDR